MRHLPFVALLSLFTSLSLADVLEIDYSGGKKAETVTITLDNGSNITPDSIRIGDAFLIRTYYDLAPHTGCTNSGELGLQIFTKGRVWRRTDRDTNWGAYNSYPADSGAMSLLDSVPYPPGPYPSTGGSEGRHIGYAFAQAGYADCSYDTYHVLDSTIRQVVFVGDTGFVAKLQISSFRDTTIGPPPSPYPHRRILSVKLRYVISDDPDDLVGPVAIHPKVKSQRLTRGGKAIDVDHYNPLGIRMKSGTDAIQPAFPDLREALP